MRWVSLTSSVVALLLGSLLLAAPVAVAQTSPPAPAGITVLGTGSASAPAETATIILNVGQGFYEDKMPQMPEPSGTPRMTPQETVAPVVDALTAAGVPEGDIEILSNPYSGDYGPAGGPVTSVIRFDLTAPTTEQISGLLDVAIPAATDAGLYVNMASAIYGVADCETLERQAREAAIADARQQAELQANLLDVTLGDLVASRDDPYAEIMYGGGYSGVVPINSCSQGPVNQGVSILYGAAPFDPNMRAEVIVIDYVELTFDMTTSPEATPAS
jgi:uncharacterized protein YggE